MDTIAISIIILSIGLIISSLFAIVDTSGVAFIVNGVILSALATLSAIDNSWVWMGIYIVFAIPSIWWGISLFRANDRLLEPTDLEIEIYLNTSINDTTKNK